LWAEREQVDVAKIKHTDYTCPNLQCLKEEAYISSDGDWYACCNDSKNELVFGNIKDETLDSIYSGRARREFLEMLGRKEFMRIGGPCRTVNCCQKAYYDSDDIKLLLKLKFMDIYAALRRGQRFVSGKRGN